MQFLCVCEGGCVRSVALANVLKYCQRGWNAVAIGVDHYPLIVSKVKLSTQRFVSLASHFDRIIVASEHVRDRVGDILRNAEISPEIREQIESKIILVDLGHDRWGVKLGPYNDDIVRECRNKLKEAGVL